MIIGDRTHLAFEIEPVEPSWDRCSPADRGPWAGLSVWARGRNLTRAQEEATDRVVHNVAVPLMPVAVWLADSIRAIVYEESPAIARYGVEPHDVLIRWNRADAPPGIPVDDWENERFEWYRRHFWLAGSEGSLLPDVGLVRVDGELLISWHQPTFPGPRRLLFSEPPGVERVEWSRAWEALREFVAWVAGEVRRRSIEAAVWANDESPLDTAVQCTPAQFLAYAAPCERGLLEALDVGSDEHPESRPSLLALRDLEVSPETHVDIVNAATRLDQAASRRARLTRMNELRSGVRMALNAAQPEAAGYDAARWLRSEMNLNGEPVASDRIKEALSSFADLQEIPASSVYNSAAIGSRAGAAGTVVLLRHARTRTAWAERMELARAIGHLLLDPMSGHGALGAASSRIACGPRRRRSGAFAAEFLLPSQCLAALAERGESPGTPRIFEDLMGKFGVGARTAAYHLWNRGYLLSEEDRDWLIEEYGRPLADQSTQTD